MSSSGISPVIIGVAAAVAALVCSLLAGGLYYVRRKRTQPSPVAPGAGLQALPAGYASIGAIQQEMASARVNGEYSNFPGNQPDGHYSDAINVRIPKEGEQYDQVRLSQLNAEAELPRANDNKERDMTSSRPNDPYQILPQGDGRGNYSDSLKQSQPSSSINNDVSLTQLNEEMSQQNKAQAHVN